MNSKDPMQIAVIDEPSHPGATLLEILEDRGMTQLQLAERIGLDKKTVNLIINGNAAISQDTALALELVFEISAHFWLKLEIRYQESLARKNEERRFSTADFADWATKFPYTKMVELGWLPAAKTISDKARNLLKFFAVANPKSWEEVYMAGSLESSYRRPSKAKSNFEVVSSWLRRGEILVQGLDEVPEFNKEDFTNAIAEIRKYTLVEDLSEVIEKIKERCLKSGVIYLYVEELPTLAVSGVMRWLRNRPVILQTLRYKTNDQFWFTFFHEAFHVFQNQKKKIFLDGIDLLQGDLEREAEADLKARELLIPNHLYLSYLTETEVITCSSIKSFAKDIGIHEAIVVGRLQHDGKLPWKHKASKLKVSVNAI